MIKEGIVTAVAVTGGIKLKGYDDWFNPDKSIKNKIKPDLRGRMVKIDVQGSYFISIEESNAEPIKQITPSLKVEYFISQSIGDIRVMETKIKEFCESKKVRYIQHLVYGDRLMAVVQYE